MARDWPAWHAAIGRWTRDANINKRRAALVLLAWPDALRGRCAPLL